MEERQRKQHEEAAARRTQLARAPVPPAPERSKPPLISLQEGQHFPRIIQIKWTPGAKQESRATPPPPPDFTHILCPV